MAKKLTEKQIVSLVNQEFDNSIGRPGGDVSLERAEAWDYYLSKPFGNENPDDDESEVVTSDVSEIVDGMMPSLLRLFTSADNLVSFDPVGPEDEEGSRQASDYVNYLFFKKNESFEILFFAMFDALVQKTGLMKCYWDESEEVTIENYEGLTEPELLDLMQDDELEPVEKEEREEQLIDPVSGEQVMLDVTDIQFRRVKKKGRVRVENVPPDEYRISSDARSLNPSHARMVGHERERTRSELIEMGFDKKIVNDLRPEQVSISSPERDARKDKSDDRNIESKSVDKSQDMFMLREAYQKMDADGDGRAELVQVFIVGDKLLEQTPIDRQPFHMICPHPLPHKHIGRSAAEKVMDVQLVGSTILRQTLNNLYHTNNPGHGVWEQGMGDTTMDDLLTRRLGTVVEFERPVAESYQQMTVPFTANASFPMLEYFDKVKRDRTGVSSDSEGLSPDALKNIQQSVLAQSVDLSKMKIETIARVFAETGFKTLFLHMYELVLKHQQKAEIVKLRNQWVKVNPSEWHSRENMTVNIGLGIGTREQNMLHLDAIREIQAQMVQGGGMNLTVTPDNIYNTAKEYVKNANYKQPEMFFTDPQGQQAPPPTDEAQELEKLRLEVEQRELQLDQERQQFNMQKLQLTAQESALKHQREMMALQEKAEEREDKFAAENEKLRNDLMQMSIDKQLKEIDAALKTAKSKAEIDKIRADTRKVMEDIRKSQAEQPPEDSEADIAKSLAEIEKIRAETEKVQAETTKTQVESESAAIENEATVTGLRDLAEGMADDESE